jgi:hypothetical protein
MSRKWTLDRIQKALAGQSPLDLLSRFANENNISDGDLNTALTEASTLAMVEARQGRFFLYRFFAIRVGGVSSTGGTKLLSTYNRYLISFHHFRAQYSKYYILRFRGMM